MNDSHYQAATQNSSGYYEIGNAGQLYWFANYINVDGGSEYIVNAKLTADITVNKKVLDNNYNLNSNSSSFRSWTPINRTFYYGFKGTFDGCNYTISGLYNNGYNKEMGLFGILSMDGGTVKDVTLKDTYFYSTADHCGGIVGNNRGEISDCSVYASIGSNKDYSGAIAGVNYGTVTNCEFKEGKVSGNNNIGGIVGQNAKGTVSKSKCYGSVSGSQQIGGIVGKNDDTVSECESLATSVISGSYRLGGIVGLNNSRIENCINRMAISVTSDITVGGITAYNSGSESTVIGCTNYGSITGNEDISGIATRNYGTVEKCGNEGSVTATGSRAADVGGITGVCYNYGQIINCYNKGDIFCSYQDVGGILGRIANNTCVISNCWNSGKVSGAAGYIGGILGRNLNSQCVSNCYYNSDRRATTQDGKEQNGIGANTGSTTADTSGRTIAKNAIEFKSGAVAYLLNNGTTNGSQVWYQNIDNGTPDEYPVLNSQSGTVYITSPCVSGTNKSASLQKDHNFQNGVCTGCGSSCPHETVTNCQCSVCGAAVHKYNADGFCENNSSHYQEAKPDRDDYYEIGNAGQLFWFAEQVNGGNNKINGKLTANIDLKNRAWTPIGTTDYPYTVGTFNGNGKTISNLYITATGDNQGLFGVVGSGGAVVKDVTIEGKIDVSANAKYIGGVVGKIDHTADIYNVVSRVTITDIRTGVDTTKEKNRISGVGGIAGSITKSTLLQNCSYYGSITIQCGASVGGVVGIAQENSHLLRCDNYGTVKSGENSAHIGGILGDAQSGTIVNKCINYGTVTSEGADCIGGVVAYANNATSIQSCGNVGTITCENSAGGFIGGILGYINNDNFGYLKNCYNYGSIVTNSGDKNHPGAIIGWCRNTNVSMVKNNYYLETSYSAASNGTAVSATAYKAADFKSGKVAYMLNGGDNGEWKQTVNSDNYPNFSGLSVYAGYVCGSGSSEISYTNSTSELVSTPSPEHNMENGICKNCGAYQSAANNNGVYEISNLGQLLWFEEYVGNGNTNANGRLTADVDASSQESLGIGSSSRKYAGTFDGNGYTLNIKLTGSESVALFPYVNGATIRNLKLKGNINASGKFAASIAGRAEGNVTIEKCLSEVVITSTVNGDGTHGGLVGVNAGTMTINNCGFTGKIVGSSTTHCGGFVGWSDGTNNISNSFIAANFDNTSGCNTFARNKVTLTNCYYLNSLGDVPSGATQKTADQFAGGEVTSLLNGSKSEGNIAWYQTIGSDTVPVFKGKTVFKNASGYYNAAKTGDINGDDEVDIRDLVRMKKNLAAGSSAADMDLDRDKKSDSKDMVLLRKFLMNIISVFS